MTPTSTPQADGAPGERRSVALLIAIVGAAVTSLGSWHVSFWTDEAVTATAASRSLGQLWNLTGHIDAVHGAYYTLMNLWVDVFGASPFFLRLPSAIAVGLAAAGTYRLGGMLAGPRTGVLAAFMMILLPRATWMGIEARSFAFGATVAIWLTVLLVARLAARPRTSAVPAAVAWGGYALLTALGIALNLYVALVLCAHGVSLLLSRSVSWRQRFSWLGSALAGVVAASPIIRYSLAQSSQIAENELGPAEWIRNVFVNQWFLGGTPTGGATSQFPDLLWKGASVVLAAVCWTLVLWFVASVVRRGGATGDADVLLWAGPIVVVPTLAIVAYSSLGDPMYNPRYLAFATPGVALLVAAGLSRVRAAGRRSAVLGLIVLLAVPVYLSQRTTDAKSGADWSEAAAFVGRNSTPGDAVYFAPRVATDSATVEQTMRRIQVAYPAPFEGLDDVTLLTTGDEDASIDGTSAPLAARLDTLSGEDRVWVIEHLSYPPEASEEDAAMLGSLGFTQHTEWHGSLTRVIGFER